MAAVAATKSFSMQVDGLKQVSFPDKNTVTLQFESLEKAQGFSKKAAENASQLNQSLLNCSSPDDKEGVRIFCLKGRCIGPGDESEQSRATSIFQATQWLGSAANCSTAAKYVVEYIEPKTEEAKTSK